MRFITLGLIAACLASAAPANAQDSDFDDWLDGVADELSQVRVSHTTAMVLWSCCAANREKVEAAFMDARESFARTREFATRSPARRCREMTFLALSIGKVRTRMAILRAEGESQDQSTVFLEALEGYRDRVAALANSVRTKRSELGCET